MKDNPWKVSGSVDSWTGFDFGETIPEIVGNIL